MPLTHSPYARLMRLDKPIGIWLLFWPCAWGAALGAEFLPIKQLLLMLAGAVLMRSAGCIINDIWDKDFDAQVARTRTRPLASGELSVKQALGLLAVLLSLSLLVAVALGWQVVLWSAAALPLVAAYPLMKRITYWPQAFLGLTFNWGALLGWVSIHGQPQLPALLLYAGGLFWTLGYDTIYAHQDKTDDAKIGVKSTALALGERTLPAVRAFYVLATLFWLAAGHAAAASAAYFGLLALVLTLLLRQTCLVNLNDPATCRRAFIMNNQAGGLLFAACVLARL